MFKTWDNARFPNKVNSVQKYFFLEKSLIDSPLEPLDKYVHVSLCYLFSQLHKFLSVIHLNIFDLKKNLELKKNNNLRIKSKLLETNRF